MKYIVVICIYNYQNYIALDFSIEFSFTLLWQYLNQKFNTTNYVQNCSYVLITVVTTLVFVIYEIYKAK